MEAVAGVQQRTPVRPVGDTGQTGLDSGRRPDRSGIGPLRDLREGRGNYHVYVVKDG